MWELVYKESWAPKNWCFWTVVLEKTLKSPLDCKEIQPVHPEGDQPWGSFGRNDAKAETPVLWPLDAKNQSLEKPLMLGKTESGRRRGWQRMRRLDGITDSMDMSLSKLHELAMEGKPGLLQPMWPQSVKHDWATDHVQTNRPEATILGFLKRNFAFREKISKGKLKWGKDERFRRALLEVSCCRNEIKDMEINGSFVPNVLQTDIMSLKRSVSSLP